MSELLLPPAGWHWSRYRTAGLVRGWTDAQLEAARDSHMCSAIFRYQRVHLNDSGVSLCWLEVLEVIDHEIAVRWMAQRQIKREAALTRRFRRRMKQAA